MYFAKYVGPSDAPQWTKGKVYLARPEMDGHGAVDWTRLKISADDGRGHTLSAGNGFFEFCEEAYGVVVEDVADMEKGEVVRLENAAFESGPEPTMYGVREVGFIQASKIVILDHVTLFPGLWVLDTRSGRWRVVTGVADGMLVEVEADADFRLPTDFEFWVVDRDIAVRPVVMCVDATGAGGLKEGEYYWLIEGRPSDVGTDREVTVKGADDRERRCFGSRFSERICREV